MNNPYVKTLEPCWSNLDNVFVNEKKLYDLIEKMREEELETSNWAVSNVHPPADCKLTEWINFICWINTLNFAFANFEPPHNKFTIEHPKGVFWSGAFALEASFMRAYSEGIPVFDAEYMSRISLKRVSQIFRAVDSQHQIPMLKERWKVLQEIGRILIEKYSGFWLNMFWDADWRAFNNGKGIVEQLVANFPSFRDERDYKGYHLKFNKRAQLLVTMYQGRAVNSQAKRPPFQIPLIKDIENIGPIADYTVPKALKFLGVLEYSSEFERAIQKHKIFRPGDLEEVENRLAMSYVMKRICDELGVNMAQVDFYIWHLGRKSNAPHILVPTTDY